MNNKSTLTVFRILLTIFLILSGIFCFPGYWWKKFYLLIDGMSYTNTTFYDAVGEWASSAFPFGIVLCAVLLGIVLLWTKAYRYTIIPALVIAIIVGISYFSIFGLQREGGAMILPLGTLHFVLSDAIFVLCCVLTAISPEKKSYISQDYVWEDNKWEDNE